MENGGTFYYSLFRLDHTYYISVLNKSTLEDKFDKFSAHMELTGYPLVHSCLFTKWSLIIGIIFKLEPNQFSRLHFFLGISIKKIFGVK